MTPGDYIQLRREAAGLSIGDVMAVLAGGGMLSAPLEEIEAGSAMPTGFDVALLSFAFQLDDMIVARMKDGEPVQVCQTCGCSEGFACESGDFGRCWLTKAGTCSTCELKARVEARAA